MKTLTQFINEALGCDCTAICKKIKDAIKVLPKSGVCFLIQSSGSMLGVQKGCATELDKLFNENGYDIYYWDEKGCNKVSSVNDINIGGPHLLDACIASIKKLSEKYKCICVLGDSQYKSDKAKEDAFRELSKKMNKNLYWFYIDDDHNISRSEFAKMLNKTINCA